MTKEVKKFNELKRKAEEINAIFNSKLNGLREDIKRSYKTGGH